MHVNVNAVILRALTLYLNYLKANLKIIDDIFFMKYTEAGYGIFLVPFILYISYLSFFQDDYFFPISECISDYVPCV